MKNGHDDKTEEKPKLTASQYAEQVARMAFAPPAPDPRTFEAEQDIWEEETSPDGTVMMRHVRTNERITMRRFRRMQKNIDTLPGVH